MNYLRQLQDLVEYHLDYQSIEKKRLTSQTFDAVRIQRYYPSSTRWTGEFPQDEITCRCQNKWLSQAHCFDANYVCKDRWAQIPDWEQIKPCGSCQCYLIHLITFREQSMLGGFTVDNKISAIESAFSLSVQSTQDSTVKDSDVTLPLIHALNDEWDELTDADLIWPPPNEPTASF